MKKRETYVLTRIHDDQPVDRDDFTDSEVEAANIRLATVCARVWGEPDYEWRLAEIMGADAPKGWLP
jgi:hypothetical protein